MADRYELSREFEETLLKHRIQKTTDVEMLHQIAYALVESNFHLLAQNKRLMGFGPWGDSKKSPTSEG